MALRNGMQTNADLILCQALRRTGSNLMILTKSVHRLLAVKYFQIDFM